jgi:hypothetical protein
MVAEQKGNVKSIDYINWLMGFTYSFYFIDKYALPYYDPEEGYENASQYLGLKRNYLVSNDSDIFVSNLKKQLSLNIPLRIALNSSTLYNSQGFSPHSILVTGYSKDTIYYFETGGKDRRVLNYLGEKVDLHRFLSSIRNISNNFGYPWLYNMSSFDSCNQNKDLEKVWTRNGSYMIGHAYGPMSIGSKGIMSFAEYIKNNELKDWQYSLFTMALDMGIYTRADNSNFIRTNFVNQKFQKIAELFLKSSDLFKDAKQAMLEKDKNTVVKKLNEIAEIELSIGKLLKEQGN